MQILFSKELPQRLVGERNGDTMSGGTMMEPEPKPDHERLVECWRCHLMIVCYLQHESKNDCIKALGDAYTQLAQRLEKLEQK